MLKKRIIACFDIKDGKTVKGVTFKDIKYAGNAVELAKKYVKAGVDELVFLDISATIEKRETLTTLVEEIASEINIPFTVGGGINRVEDAERLIRLGADKICINSSAVKNPGLISDLASTFGSQAVVLAMDVKSIKDYHEVFINGGTTATGNSAVTWAKEAEALGAGEILLTSMDYDGTKQGYDIDLVKTICDTVNLPVIASGGAGDSSHFKNLFCFTPATGGLAASIFHFNQINISKLKKYLKQENIPVR